MIILTSINNLGSKQNFVGLKSIPISYQFYKKNSIMFDSTYRVVQTIQQRKTRTTSIVTDNKGKYFISKRIVNNNAQLMNEIETMKKMKHPNLVNVHDVLFEPDAIYIIEQYCEEGDLAFHMHRRSKRRGRYYPEETVARWVLQIVMALDYLHSRKIVHRDLRLDNVFLTAQGNIKVGTFKLLKSHEKQTGLGLSYSLIVSSNYTAPETAQKNAYDQKTDIWSLGSLIQQLCTLKPNNIIQNAQRVFKGKIDDLPLIYSEQLNEICSNCLQANPAQRPSSYQLLGNPYFVSYIKNFIKKPMIPEIAKRIPIKKYQIHKKNEEKQKIEQLKSLNIQRKKSGQSVPLSSIIMKRTSMEQTRGKQFKMSSREDAPYNIKIQAIKDVEKLGRYNFQRKSSIQMRKDRDKLPEIKQPLTRSKSREVKKRTSLNKMQQKAQKIQRMQKQQKSQNVQSSTSIGDQHDHKSGQASSQPMSNNSLQSPKKKLPPPRPPRKKSFGQNASDVKLSPKVQNLTLEEYTKQMSKSQLKQPGKFQQHIKSEVDKAIGNLLTVKGDLEQQEISFELDDEDDQIRLTSAKHQAAEQMVDAYKTKLDQLLKWMACKYSPNMETIMERTMEMDSNTFQKLRM